ncbi:unnamed protein product [Arctia plantaginis]|uniref:Uncharacterized protein n=1 Tax=Arctia plantaginis TaxID=874455 RepID=A0A8S1BDX1_ARCPL|nr:unnamed protein product [Arctia plantaginis]
MRYKVRFLLLFLYSVQANLEGPFLFFGSKSLEKYKRPALTYLDQDDLMRIYGEAEAIVVFNNQDSVPLSSLYFPRLRKMLEGQTTLVLPQDFLDVHPDYISNETQVLTLEGPWSERDAQMTETFARLQDVYGAGKVLGILGNSVSQSQSVDYVDGEPWARVRRQAFTNDTISTSDEDKPQKRQRYALYNATGAKVMGSTEAFDDAFDCIGFYTVPICNPEQFTQPARLISMRAESGSKPKPTLLACFPH